MKMTFFSFDEDSDLQEERCVELHIEVSNFPCPMSSVANRICKEAFLRCHHQPVAPGQNHPVLHRWRDHDLLYRISE